MRTAATRLARSDTPMKTNPHHFLFRTILSALAAVSLMSAKLVAAQASQPESRPAQEFLELRAYHLKPDATGALLDAYLEEAFIPALNARGVRAVGVFTEPEAKDGPAVWVLIPHRSLESMAAINAEINRDARVLTAGADYLKSPTKEDPAFERMDSWLMLSFAGMPALEVPALAREEQDRIFELRVYESFSELTALKKIEMFNAGEIDVMREVGLSPVFYGQALTGSDLPHLAYMLCSADREAHQKNWRAFGQHPVWVGLRNDPQYADTVSKITSRFLVPKPYSQI